MLLACLPPPGINRIHVIEYCEMSIELPEVVLKKQVICVALSLIWTACFSSLTSVSDTQKPNQAASQSSPPAANSDQNVPAIGTDFVIGSGDILSIFVWKEPEVSKSVPVRPDGKISLPLVNDVQASGLTALDLKKVLEEKLSKFFEEPNVTVTVETVNSQKVTVMGEVNGAGPKPLAGPTRVMDILAISGFTPFAKTTKVYILREIDGKQQRLNFNYKDYIKGKNPEQNILLRNGDTIVVP